jgi:hypothetical protein
MAWKDVVSLKNQLLATAPDGVERRSDLGEMMSFKIARHVLIDLQALLAEIEDDIGNLIPDQISTNIQSQLLEFLGLLQNGIGNFQQNSPNAYDTKNEIENRIRNSYQGIFVALSSVIAISALRKNTLNSVSSRLNEIRVEFENQTRDLQSRTSEFLSILQSERESSARDAQNRLKIIDEHATSLAEIVEGARKDSAEISTAHEAEYFSSAADAYRNASWIWLGASLSAFFVLIYVAMYFLGIANSGFYKNIDTIEATQIAISKALMVAVIAYGTSVCSRNYFANRHNEVVNRHRSNAISSYRALVSAVNAPEHRDIVLQQAASAVFAPQDTAFVRSTNSGPEIPSNIVNLLPKPPGG